MPTTTRWFTDNGVEIAPGLRVFTNDWRWGTVTARQFEPDRADQLTGINGPYFDGWFEVTLEPTADHGEVTKIYNGERMTTVKPT